MVNYNIREATEDDCEEIMQMLKELITFGKMADQLTVTADDLKRLGFGEKQYFQALVAELITDGSDGKQRPLVGMLVYDYTFDGFRGATARMINFYVDEEWRGKGIGSALWATLAQNALSMGCVSMFWEVWSWNTHANSYYKRRGSIDISGDEHRILFGLEKNNMKKLIADVLPNGGHIEDKSGSA
ncbi:diamine acetyltransferase 1-like [Babylonia areolata]|uniref:diamine acetyltransferase 1-like n=1 Tax=Babylonia areolata TaxID=304850 RepID=UPI003FD1B608